MLNETAETFGRTRKEITIQRDFAEVLLASGYSVDGQAIELLERGCDGFMQKPFTMEDLSGKVDQILNR